MNVIIWLLIVGFIIKKTAEVLKDKKGVLEQWLEREDGLSETQDEAEEDDDLLTKTITIRRKARKAKKSQSQPLFTPVDDLPIEGGRVELEVLNKPTENEELPKNQLLITEETDKEELQKELRKAIVMKEILDPKWH